MARRPILACVAALALAGCSVVAALGGDYGLVDASPVDGATPPVDGGVDGNLDARDATVPVTDTAGDRSVIDAPDSAPVDTSEDAPAPPPDAACTACAQDAGVITLYVGGAGSSPYYIAAGAGFVYWTDKALGDVTYVRVPPLGPLPPPPPMPQPVVMGGGPQVIVVSGTVAYWADENQGAVYSNTLEAGVQFVGMPGGTGVPFGVAVTSSGGVFCTTSTGSVDENSPTVQALTTAGNPSLGYLVTDGTYLYWVTPSAGTVQAAAIGSPSSATTLAMNQMQPTGIAVGGGQIFWVNNEDGTIWHSPTGGGAGALALVTLDSPGVSNIVYAYPYVYWTNETAGTVSRCSAPDCDAGAVVIAAGQAQPFGIAADGNYVYWTNAGSGGSGGGVMAIHK